MHVHDLLLSYINYKKLCRDKISDIYFDENLSDEISNETKFFHDESVRFQEL